MLMRYLTTTSHPQTLPPAPLTHRAATTPSPTPPNNINNNNLIICTNKIRISSGPHKTTQARATWDGTTDKENTAIVTGEGVPPPPPPPPPCEVVRRFYDGINGRDLATVELLFAEDCVYEDLIFPEPFVGRKAILDFFKKFIDSISSDLQFVIDDISANDPFAVGVTWHLEWKQKAFPFSKGCSFYRLKVINGNRLIIYGRDSVEPAFKPGETTLVAIRCVVWLLQRFPQLADML